MAADASKSSLDFHSHCGCSISSKVSFWIVAERAFDVLSLGIVFVLALTLQFNVIQTGWNELNTQSASAANNTNNNYVLFALIGLLVITIILLYLFRNKFQKTLQGLKHIIAGIWEGVISATKLKKHNLFFLYSFGIWFMYLLATYIGLFGTEGTGSSFATAISCLAFASIGMIITPGGIGAYALFMAMVLKLNGVSYTLGLANGTVQWFAQFIILLILGGTSLILLPIINKKEI
jgi:uncharacterized membrane protein YbhN (UPF0104 family)